MFFAITAFVLAIAAVLVGGAALIIFVQARMTQRAISSSWNRRFANVEQILKQTSNAQLAVDQAALAAAVEKLARSVRSQFGSINAKLGDAALRAQEATANAPVGNNGERPSREQLRAKYLRPPVLGENGSE